MTAVTMDSNGDNWDPALSRLLSSLEECGSAETEEASFLAELLRSRALHALVAAHNRIVAAGRDVRCRPLLATGTSIAIDVIDIFNETEQPTDLAAELLNLLQSPHLQAVLCAHDAVAQKDYAPRLPAPPAPAAPDDDEQTVKIVQLVKSDEPLGGAQSAEPIVGATIKSDEQTGRIVIARVMHGGAADRSGLIHAGDEVVEVNGVDVESKTPADVLAILQSSEGTITFKLVPAGAGAGGRESKVRVRALFDYRAADDPHIPCKEAGLDFQKGDVLHIVCQDDAYWWQARREGERRARAGLVPSRALQESRVMHQRQTAPLTLDGEVAECPGTTAAAALLPCKTAVKVKKITYDVSEKDDFDRECIPTYEEVARLYPRAGRHRPLVLVGAPGVGRNELRRRLLATDPALYASPVPLTSRAQRPGERAGEQYEFTTREALERDAAAGRLLEHGEYKGHLYATTAASVHALIDAGRICVLSPHWQALRMLRTARLRPYIIFIKPPTLDRLVETRTATHARSTFDKDNNRAFTEEEFTDIIRSSNRISFLYGHLFDEEIVNEDIGTALSTLLRASWKVQSEPLWVPSSWVQ